jgi:hypothetical protein
MHGLDTVTDDWQCDIDNGRLVGAVLLDFSAADLIDHFLLLDTFKQYGFTGTGLNWMESYLSNRKQRVFFNGSFSDFSHVNCGVPQGSCLGPLLFLIFINDLPLLLQKSQFSMYADDSTIYVAGLNTVEIHTILDNELHLVIRWIEANKLVLNVGKTKSILIGTRYQLSSEPKLNLSINNISVKQVKETNF